MRRSLRNHLVPLVPLVAAASLAGCATLGQINIVSEEQELQMGAQFAAELESQLRFIEDAAVVGYVDNLGQSLARVSQRNDIPYTFHVVDTDEINAFALPGGYLYVHRGLIEAADNEAELAGVLAHEIGHVVGRHSARQLSQQMGVSVLAGIALGQDPNVVAELAAQIAATGALMSYSRDMESEADEYGVQETYDAGINPVGIATFFDKLVALRDGAESGAVEHFFSSHPDPGVRAATVRALIATLPPKNLRLNTPQFDSAKAKLNAMPRPPAGR
jgi:predicted Zn-dependent protease